MKLEKDFTFPVNQSYVKRFYDIAFIGIFLAALWSIFTNLDIRVINIFFLLNNILIYMGLWFGFKLDYNLNKNIKISKLEEHVLSIFSILLLINAYLLYKEVSPLLRTIPVEELNQFTPEALSKIITTIINNTVFYVPLYVIMGITYLIFCFFYLRRGGELLISKYLPTRLFSSGDAFLLSLIIGVIITWIFRPSIEYAIIIGGCGLIIPLFLLIPFANVRHNSATFQNEEKEDSIIKKDNRIIFIILLLFYFFLYKFIKSKK